MPIQTTKARVLVQIYQWDRSVSSSDISSNKITEILLTIQVFQPVVPHNPQHIIDKIVCHLVVNNVFKTRFTSARTGFFTPQPLRLWGIVITRGGRAGGRQSEIQLLLKN